MRPEDQQCLSRGDKPKQKVSRAELHVHVSNIGKNHNKSMQRHRVRFAPQRVKPQIFSVIDIFQSPSVFVEI